MFGLNFPHDPAHVVLAIKDRKMVYDRCGLMPHRGLRERVSIHEGVITDPDMSYTATHK